MPKLGNWEKYHVLYCINRHFLCSKTHIFNWKKILQSLMKALKFFRELLCFPDILFYKHTYIHIYLADEWFFGNPNPSFTTMDNRKGKVMFPTFDFMKSLKFDKVSLWISLSLNASVRKSLAGWKWQLEQSSRKNWWCKWRSSNNTVFC